MNLFKPLFTIFAVFLVFMSCTDEKSKQDAIKLKEQALLEKEKSLALKEAEYQSLLKLRDSIASAQDSTAVNPLAALIMGEWKGKIVCTESNCQDYVVGDTRIDDWEVSELNGEIIAKNLNKSGTVRVYKGKFEGATLVMKHTSESPEKRLDLKLNFTTVEPGKLSGTREVQVNQSCVSKFSIELLR